MEEIGCDIAVLDDLSFRGESIILSLEASGVGQKHILCGLGSELGQLQDFASGADRLMFLCVLGGGSICMDTITDIFLRLRALRPDALLVAIVDHHSPAEVEAAIAVELDGVIPTSFSRAVVAAALRFIIAGGRYFPHGTKTSVIGRDGHVGGTDRAKCLDQPRRDRVDDRDIGQDLEEGAASPHLTSRQTEVFGALRQGQSNKVIARNLDISEATVKLHVRQILRKFNASNRTQIAIMTRMSPT